MFKAIGYIVVLLAFIVGYVKYLETRGIYYPTKDIEFTPRVLGLAFEDIYLKTQDNLQLNGWYIPHQQAQYTMLFCHGNAGNIAHRLEKLIMLQKIPLNLFIIDYRGYGRSQGRPKEQGLYLDAQAAYDYLVNERKVQPQDIVLYGESLGCAVVIHLGADNEIGALIVEGAFTKGRDMAKRIYPFLPAALFADSFNSLARIKTLKAPKLFLHSKDDEVVPLGLAQRLYAAAPEPKQFAELSGGHNSAFLDAQEQYLAAIKLFIDQLYQK